MRRESKRLIWLVDSGIKPFDIYLREEVGKTDKKKYVRAFIITPYYSSEKVVEIKNSLWNKINGISTPCLSKIVMDEIITHYRNKKIEACYM